MTGARQSVITAKGLGRRFGKRWALKGIDFEIRETEIFGLVGPDGAGKTTLLQMLAAILDPSEGSCTTLGADTVRDAPWITSQIGYMAQGFTLYGKLSVAENLSFAAEVRNVPQREFQARRDRLLEMAALKPFLHRPEEELSGGMRKKLALCTNLIHQPPLLLLDEPGLGVDPVSRRELWLMLEDFRKAGATIVFSTSYMDEAGRCDRLAFLHGGNLVAKGTPADLRALAQGAVYSIRTNKPSPIEARLQGATAVIGIQRRSDELRLIIDPAQGLSPEIESELKAFGEISPAKPTMEDAFVLISSREASESADGRDFLSGNQPDKMPPLSERAIETNQLTRRFGSFVAVDRVSFSVAPGEIFGLLGANGAGKTTLIRMLCGLLPPSDGSAVVAGHEVSKETKDLRQDIGYMSQRFSLYPDLTVAENLDFFASAYGLRRQKAGRSIDWAQQVAGLKGLEDRQARALSGALRQRLALACSILHQPKVLFLDEPTSGIAPLSRFRFWRLINLLAARGTAVVVTTHNLEEAVFCHRLGLMHEGRMIAMGRLDELRQSLPGSEPLTVEEIFLASIERAREAQSTAAGQQL